MAFYECNTGSSYTKPTIIAVSTINNFTGTLTADKTYFSYIINLQKTGLIKINYRTQCHINTDSGKKSPLCIISDSVQADTTGDILVKDLQTNTQSLYVETLFNARSTYVVLKQLAGSTTDQYRNKATFIYVEQY